MSPKSLAGGDGPHKSADFLVLLALAVAMIAFAITLTAEGPFGDDLRQLGHQLVGSMTTPNVPTGMGRPVPSGLDVNRGAPTP
jgi:hypothetical protein